MGITDILSGHLEIWKSNKGPWCNGSIPVSKTVCPGSNPGGPAINVNIKMERRVILNMAISLDGFITDIDGGFGWIVGDGDKSHDTESQFNFEDFTNSVDTIVMGRKAYEDCPEETLESFKKHKIYVATSKEMNSECENVEFINGDIVNLIEEERKKEGKAIWIFGGAGLADPFIKADVIDEYIIGFIPTILGSGRELFLKDNPTIKLHLKESTTQDGIVIVRYLKR